MHIGLVDSEWNSNTLVHVNEDMVSEANGVAFHIPRPAKAQFLPPCANAQCTLRDGQILYNSTSPQHTFRHIPKST